MQVVTASVLLSLLTLVSGETGSSNDAAGEHSADGSDVGADAHSGEGEEHHEPHAANAVLFLFTALVFGILLRRAMSGFIIPYTGLLVVVGMAIGLIDQKANWEHLGEGIQIWLGMPPTLFLLVFLPILLYGSGSSLDWHTFFRNVNPILTLAFPGVAIHTTLVAVIYKYVFPYGWSWKESFLFGSIISATDPVAVVAIMKEVGASKRLGHLIEGESLLNDGSAYVLFLIFQDMLISESPRSAGATVGYLFELVFVAALLGAAFGLVTTLVLALVYRDTVLEITLTVASAFLCFWVAEDILGVSGVLAVVTLAIWMAAIGKYAISPEVTHSMHLFWEVAEFMANTLVFFVFGVIVAERIYVGHNPPEGGPPDLEGADWGWAIANWVFLNLIRFCTISMLKPLMNRVGADGFTWYDVIVATWAGLRGAVGLSLGLIIYLTAVNDPEKGLDQKFALITVFFVGTMSILTIIVQGASMPWLLAALKITKKTPIQVQHLLIAAKEMEDYADKHLAHLKNDTVLGAPDWDEVMATTAIDCGELLPSKKVLRRLLDSIEGQDTTAPPDSAPAASSQLLTPIPSDPHPGAADTAAAAGGGARGAGAGAVGGEAPHKRNSAPAASTLAALGLRKPSFGRQRHSAKGDRLEALFQEERPHKWRDNGCLLHSEQSLKKESLVALKNEGEAAEQEAEMRLRSSKSANLELLATRHSSEKPLADALSLVPNPSWPLDPPSAGAFAALTKSPPDGGEVITGTKTESGKDLASEMTKRQRTLQELRKRRGAKRHHHAENQQLNIDKILRAFQNDDNEQVSEEASRRDLRARYLHAASAVYAEGFEKGYLSGEQQAVLHSLTASALDRTHAPIDDFVGLRKLVETPLYIRLLVKLFVTLGRLIPGMRIVGERILFLNMESDIGAAAAFVYAHGEAIKGLEQMLQLIDVHYDTVHEDGRAYADTDTRLVKEVLEEGKQSRAEAVKLLEGFRRDYPTLVRAVKTRSAAQTVLMHKSRFVHGALKAGLLEEKEGNQLLELIHARVKALYFCAPTLDLPRTYDIIHKHYLFEHFSDYDLKSILESGDIVVYNPGEALFHAGQPPLRVYIVLRGSATRAATDGGHVRVNGTGAAVGLGEALTDIPRLSDVKADTHIEAFYLTTKVFRHIMDSNETFRLRAFQIAAASVSLHLCFPFVRGMGFDELLETFKASRILPDVARGNTFTISEPALLMTGSVTAFVAERKMTNLKRIGSMRAVLRRTSALPPTAVRNVNVGVAEYLDQSMGTPFLKGPLVHAASAESEVVGGGEEDAVIQTITEAQEEDLEEVEEGADSSEDAEGPAAAAATASPGAGTPGTAAATPEAGAATTPATPETTLTQPSQIIASSPSPGGKTVGGKDVVIDAPALLEPGTYPVATDSVVLTLPVHAPRDHNKKMADTIRKITLYRQSQQSAPDALMGVVRNAVGIMGKSYAQAPPDSGGAGTGGATISGGGGRSGPMATGYPSPQQRTLYSNASLTRASMPITPFVKPDGTIIPGVLNTSINTNSPVHMLASSHRRRSSHEGVVQVPGITRTRLSAASSAAAGTPGSGGSPRTPTSAAAGVAAAGGGGAVGGGTPTPLYAVPEAGESRANLNSLVADADVGTPDGGGTPVPGSDAGGSVTEAVIQAEASVEDSKPSPLEPQS